MAAPAAPRQMLGSWDWQNEHVQQRDAVSESRFINAATVLISAGPPRLAGPNSSVAANSGLRTGDNLVFPIGVCTDANITQQRQFQRIYEIGSDRSYGIQGRTSGAITLNRVLFNGASLLRVLYAYYPEARNAAVSVAHNVYEGATVSGAVDQTGLNSVATTVEAKLLDYTGETELPPIRMDPGQNSFYVNLASDLFNHPLGLMFTFQDIHKRDLASFFCEMCFVNTQAMQFTANGGSIISEQVRLDFDRIAPIKVIGATNSVTASAEAASPQ